MNWLSHNAEKLVAQCPDTNGTTAAIDVVVVGSGYGGAVAALRFAEAGQNVYVLERGREYVSGEFPNDLSQVGKHVRSEFASTSGVSVQGYDDALFDFRIGLRAGALIGNGLGGGSLINAGVGLQPDDRVFEHEDWPAALRQEDLAHWFDKARAMHELQTAGRPAPGHTQPMDVLATEKFMRMKELGAIAASQFRNKQNEEDMEVTFEAAPIAVQLDSPARQDLGPREPCIGCGDCITGCNNKAKLSLTSTYLPRAIKAGATMFTGVSVLHVSHKPQENAAFPWVVYFIRTDERKLHHDLARQAPEYKTPQRVNPKDDGWVYKLRAANVVLAAGAFGSTEIMLRSRDKGLSLSNTALGLGISGNGDDVALAYDLKKPAFNTGWGSSADPHPAVGPTISSVIRFRDPREVRKGTLVQDGTVPGLMRGVVHELFTSLGTLAQMGSLRFRKYGGHDWLALNPKVLERCLTVLGMGHDSAGGVMVFDRKTDRMGWGWPKAADETTPDLHKGRLQKAIEKMGALFIQNPAVNALPDSMSEVLSGPRAGGALFTVHPLGGCRMGDMSITGVVNHWGAAWTADGELHKGLYVMDGSIIPASLGANPMLTITALAERACSMILKSMKKEKAQDASLPPYPECHEPLQVKAPVHSSAKLSEVLRGEMTLQPGRDKQLPPSPIQKLGQKNGTISAALFLDFDVPHWQGLFDDPLHEVSLVFPEGKSYTTSRLELATPASNGVLPSDLERVVLTVTGGKVNFFCQRRDGGWSASGRWLRTAVTYWAYRWGPDLAKRDRTKKLPLCKRIKRLWTYMWGGVKLIGHASEVREFVYELKLVDTDNKLYALSGRKTVEAAASWSALWQWLKTRLACEGWPAPRRRSLWQQITEVEMTLSADSDDQREKPPAVIFHGRLSMDIPDMMRRVMPKIGPQRDSLGALLELAGYPLLLMRCMLKMRLLDFRLPDYLEDAKGKPDLPQTDPAFIDKPEGHFELGDVHYPDLPPHPDDTSCEVIKPEKPVMLEVPLTWRRTADEDVEMIRLGLVRYRQKKLETHEEDGLQRVKSIVLLNGFDLSTKPFVAKELDGVDGGNLATQLHHAGWDVWLFEYRPSPLLDASARFSNMDDIAAFDIPKAVKHIICTVRRELGNPELADKTQIFAFSHCVGSAAMAMSMLRGSLCHSASGKPQLAGVLFSQYHPFMVGSVTAQTRLQFGAFLHNLLGIDTLQFTAGKVEADLLYAMLDRLFASANYAQAGDLEPCFHELRSETCPGEGDLRRKRPDSTTCKRMTGLLSRLFQHDQLLPETHENLDAYFGRSNMGVYIHGAKCVDYERLVNADGQNVYLTDDLMRKHLDMPLMFLHGEKNVLFDKESWARTLMQMTRLFNANEWEFLNEKLKTPLGQDLDFSIGKVRGLRVAGHAHFDCTIGMNAPARIFRPVVNFFGNAFSGNDVQKKGQQRCRARMALTGPIVGWVRPGSKGMTLVRIWIEVDGSHADQPVAAMTIVKSQSSAFRKVQAWDITPQNFVSVDSTFPGDAAKSDMSKIVYAVADIELPDEELDDLNIEMVSIHSFCGSRPAQERQGKVCPSEWGTPLTVLELGGVATGGKADSGGDQRTAAAGPAGLILPGINLPFSYGKFIQDRRRAPNAGESHLQSTNAQLGTLVEQAGSNVPVNAHESDEANELQIRPMDLGGVVLDEQAFMDVLKHDLQASNTLVHAVAPPTLSRLRRTLRRYDQRIIKLKRPQLENTGIGLTFFAAACRHPGLTGFEYTRADATLLQASRDIEAVKPAFMVMLGDQIYADARAGVLDIQSPIEKLLPRYRKAFGSSASFRELAARLPLYMLIDDHEINDSWSVEQWNTGNASEILASNAMDAYKVFQYAHGPGQQVPPKTSGQFTYAFNRGGLPFIALDTRTRRTRVPDRQIMPVTQWAWLEQWLLDEQKKGSHPKFLMSGSVFAPALSGDSGLPSPRSADSWLFSPSERSRLLSFLVTHKIHNVVFLSSDYHCSAVAEITFSEDRALKALAIVAPPLHAPMRFANSEASEIRRAERIQLDRGFASVNAKAAWDGDGWLECSVKLQVQGEWTLACAFHLKELENKAWTKKSHEWTCSTS